MTIYAITIIGSITPDRILYNLCGPQKIIYFYVYVLLLLHYHYLAVELHLLPTINLPIH